MALHQSDLGEHAHRFPSDNDGNVPEEGDHWRDLSFDHRANDPDEPGISEEERARRIAFLDQEWWPKVIAQVNEQKSELAQLPGGSPIRQWRDEVMQEPPAQHGFEAEEIEDPE